MKRMTSIVCAMVVACSAHAQDGSLRVAWNTCPGGPTASPTTRFACEAAADSSTLHFVFTLNDTVMRVTRMEGTLEFVFPGVSSVGPFWHYEMEGCNNQGIDIFRVRPSGVSGLCPGVGNLLCGASGSACFATMDTYDVGPSMGLPSNRARMHVTVQRPISSPVTMRTSTQYGFELRFYMKDAGTCIGCSDEVAISWSEATLYGYGDTPPPEGTIHPLAHMSSTDPGSDATVYENCPTCGVVKDRLNTWGRLKALYR